MINNKVVIIKNMVCPRCVDTVKDIITKFFGPNFVIFT